MTAQAAGPRRGTLGRIAALTAFRLRGAATARTLLAPVVALAALQAIALAGDGAPSAVSMTTAVALAFPLLGWAARQVLDAEPDEQGRLSLLAVGGQGRATLAGLAAALAVALPLALLCVLWGELHVDAHGRPVAALVAGLAVGAAVAVAAVALGALASRRTCGDEALPVLLLVGVPVLTAVLGLSHAPVLPHLVPPLTAVVRAAYDGRLTAAAPSLVVQVLAWSALVVAALHLRPLR